LAKCRTRSKLREALANLPPTLNATYDRIIADIDPEDFEYAIRILRWLAYSERPLLIEELAEAMAIDTTRSAIFERDDVLEDPFEALEICSSLVTVSSVRKRIASDWTYDQNPTYQIVSLAHFSVKEYLTSNRAQETRLRNINLQYSASHSILASACIGYLMQFWDPHEFNHENIEVAKLSKYCAGNWPVHANKSQDASENLQSYIVRFLLSKGPFLNFNRLYNIDAPMETPKFDMQLKSTPTPLSLAIHFNLGPIVDHLLHVGVDVNEKRGRYHTALQMSAKSGQLNITESLLTAGADVNAQGGDYYTALHMAASRGHGEIVRRLLAAGATVHDLGGCFGSVIRAAIYGESMDVFDQVLAAGPDLDIQLDYSCTALHTATARGASKMVERLLAAGADFTIRDPQFGTALYAAAYYGHDKIIRQLLSAGADVNSTGGYLGTALYAAAYHCNFRVVDLLLSAGADVKKRVSRLGTALHAAVSSIEDMSKSRFLTVQTLIRGGADLDDNNDGAGTPIHAAAHRGHLLAVEELIVAGADCEITDKMGMTPLQLAQCKGHRAVASALGGTPIVSNAGY
jgi:ankyrin repeat protein